MLNIIWLSLVILSIVFGVLDGKIHEVVMAVTNSAKLAFDIALNLAGLMTLWLGIMQIAQDSGLVKGITKFIAPILRLLFPDLPSDHPAFGAIALNMTANILGLANAATPMGLKAMEELEKLNPFPGVATNAMCMFIAINTSSIQLIPTSAIAFLSSAGSKHPTEIVFTGLLATTCSTIAAICAICVLQNRRKYKRDLSNASI